MSACTLTRSGRPHPFKQAAEPGRRQPVRLLSGTRRLVRGGSRAADQLGGLHEDGLGHLRLSLARTCIICREMRHAQGPYARAPGARSDAEADEEGERAHKAAGMAGYLNAK